MTRRNLFYIVVAFIVGVTVWIFFVDRSLKRSQYEMVNEVYVQRNPPRVSAARTSSSVSAIRSARQQVLIQDMERLNQQIIAAEKHREEQQEILVNLQKQADLSTDRPTNYASQIRDYQAEIQRFLEDIQYNEYAKTEVTRQSSFLQSDQNSSLQIAKEQLEISIQNQENLLRQTQEQITYWQNNFNYVTEQQVKLQELQNVLNEQDRQLQELKGQRGLTSTQGQEQIRSIQEQKDQVLEQLTEDSANIQQEVQGLRQAVQLLQTSQFRQQRSQMSLRAQIQQAQSDLQRQDSNLRGLRSDYVSKQQQLQSVFSADRTTVRE